MSPASSRWKQSVIRFAPNSTGIGEATALHLDQLGFKPWGIEVSLIEPGNISTKIWQRGLEWAKQMRGNLPSEAESLYGPQMDGLMRAADFMDRSGIPPTRVARAVEHALMAKRPKTRYVVGLDAQAQRFVARIPDRLRDRLLAKATAGFAKKGRDLRP